ncbi:MAG: hypothetical protein KDA96_15575, partial [Planctomycetaceae bacterium]|nr:hypothetical protein [Planctomycetaceae bacterium]
APADGVYTVDLALTKAKDYGTFRISAGEQVLDAALDLYNDPEVITTGMISYSQVPLKKGANSITFEITGAHPEAVKSYMLGIDYIRLMKTE